MYELKNYERVITRLFAISRMLRAFSKRPTDRPTDGQTNRQKDRPTKWLIDSRERDKKSVQDLKKSISHRKCKSFSNVCESKLEKKSMYC